MKSPIVDRQQLEQFNDIPAIYAEVKKNWMDIENNFDKQTPHKTADLIAKNKFLLNIVGSKL